MTNYSSYLALGFIQKIKNNNVWLFTTVNLLILFFTIRLDIQERWTSEKWKNIIGSDGRGYYSYLPTIFIDHDLSFSSTKKIEEDTYGKEGALSFLATLPDGKKANKYFSGTALLLLPFFLIAYFLSYAFGFELNGYSQLFMYSISVGAIFYLLLGLHFLKRLLFLFGCKPWIVASALIFTALGTNLFNYSSWEVSMSHVYSFAMIAIFMYHSAEYYVSGKHKNLIWAGLALGIVILIRPVNILIVLLTPFLAGNWQSFSLGLKKLFSNIKILVIIIPIVFGIPFVQCILYYLQCGQFFIDTYNKNYFDFLHPSFMNFLFSFRKGLFIYTPITFFSLFGLIPLFRENRFRAFSFLLFFLPSVYLLSSWDCWWYGGSFGMRAFIEFYSVFAVLLAFLLQSFKTKGLQYGLIIIFTGTIFLNLTQSYQYRRNIIPGDGMDLAQYKMLFLKTKRKYWGIVDKERYTFSPWNIKNKTVFFNGFEPESKFHKEPTVVDELSHTGHFCDKISSKYNYSASIIGIIPNSEKVILKTDFWAYFNRTNCDAQLVFSFEQKDGKVLNWYSFSLKEYDGEPRDWIHYDFELKAPSPKNPDDVMKIYFWTPKGYTTFIDDWLLEIYELKG